jgi:hypothetical protein
VRALRIVLACLVLWLPARAASASFAPADAVVMVAEGRGPASGAAGALAAKRAKNGQRARVALGTAKADFFALSTRLTAPAPRGDEHRARETRTVRRTIAPALFLKHCALLR